MAHALLADNLRTSGAVALRRLREHRAVISTALTLLEIYGWTLARARNIPRALTVLSRVHRATHRLRTRTAIEAYIQEHRRTLYARSECPPSAADVFTRNRLLVLKPPLGAERGVLLAMFNETLEVLSSSFDLTALLSDYTLVLEPSYPGYCRSTLLRFTAFPDDIFVLAPVHDDFSFLQRLQTNLLPVRLGPCDWVDPAVAEPYLAEPKQYDIVMNAMWSALKRHFVLFRMLANAKRRYTVALIGAAWDGRERHDIEREARFYGVLDQLTLFESVPYTKAMDITCRSRLSMLLSLKEAGPRAIAESIFCNVPAIVLSTLTGGIVKNIVPQTGIRAHERDLEAAVEYLLQAGLQPRAWGVDHISCHKSSAQLNGVLRERALSAGKPWTQDIATRSNSPECTYVLPADAARLQPLTGGLTKYLLR